MAQGEEQLATSKRILARHIADAYKAQQTSLEQLLTASSLSDVLEDMGCYLASGDQDARLASQIERDQAELDRLRRSIAATRTETQRTRMQVKAQYNEMVRQRDELKSAQERLEELETQTREAKARQLTAYNAIRKNKSQTAALLAKEKAALDGLQAQISKLIARDMGNIPSAYSGTLIWPLSGTVTQSYGCSGFALSRAAVAAGTITTASTSPLPCIPRSARPATGSSCSPARTPRPARGSGVDRRHCPLEEPRHLVCACRQREPSAGGPQGPVGEPGAGRRVRGDDRPNDGATPPLDGRTERHVLEPTRLRVTRPHGNPGHTLRWCRMAP